MWRFFALFYLNFKATISSGIGKDVRACTQWCEVCWWRKAIWKKFDDNFCSPVLNLY